MADRLVVSMIVRQLPPVGRFSQDSTWTGRFFSNLGEMMTDEGHFLISNDCTNQTYLSKQPAKINVGNISVHIIY